jgi:hypothetical protein
MKNPISAAIILIMAGMLSACGGDEGDCIQAYPVPEVDFLDHRGIGAADMNRDGLNDLVFTTSLIYGTDPVARVCGGTIPVPADGSVTVLLQDFLNPGEFLAPTRFATNSDVPHALQLADTNDDSLPDVFVTSRWRTANFEVLMHDDLNPGRLETAVSYPTIFEPHQIGTGDIDSDGRVDIVLAGNSLLTWHRQLPGGGFSDRNDVGSGDSTVAVMDFDGDMLPDMATLDGTKDWNGFTNRNPGDVLIYRQLPGLPVSFELAERVRVDGSLLMLGAGDINADDRMDVVATGLDVESGFNFVDIWYRIVQTSATPLSFADVTPRLKADNNLQVAPVIADLNGDLKEDIVFGGGKKITIFLQGATDGNFADKRAHQLPSRSLGSSPVNVEGMAVADLNGDMLPDIAVSDGDVLILFQIPGQPGRFANPVRIADWRP